MKPLAMLEPLRLLTMRVAPGIIFIYHGFPKLFTGTAEAMEFLRAWVCPAGSSTWRVLWSFSAAGC